MLRLCTSVVFALMLSLVGAAAAPAATPLNNAGPPDRAGVTRVAVVSLDDGAKGFIGSDNKFYLLDAHGGSRLAPAGHYHSADGGCIQVGLNGALDPSFVKSYASQHKQ
jgi:hypothetical protein